MMPTRERDDAGSSPRRRAVLKAVGAAAGLSLAGGATAYVSDRSYPDADGDGIPDRLERSEEFHERLSERFDGFEGLDPTRKDLLLDVRYVEGTEIAPETKSRIVSLFREHDIRAQWLDYPQRYDRDRFTATYGPNVRELLWGRDSFYRSEVDSWLRDVAIQLLVVPGHEDDAYEGLLYSSWTDALGGGDDGHVNGFSLGNRAVVANRDDQGVEERLVLHELAHLGLCHDDDPDNDGVMGTGERADLQPDEWERLRDNLHRVRDTTGYDVALRPCLWRESFGDVAEF